MTDQQFDQLFRSCYPELYRLAYSMIRDVEECRDLVSQAFTDIYENPPEYGTESQLRSYLRQRVRHRCLDYIGHLSVQERVRRLYPIELQIQRHTDSTHETLLRQVRRCVEQELTPQTRKVIELRYDQGMTYKQVADQLHISEAAVNKHVTQALSRLRLLLGQ